MRWSSILILISCHAAKAQMNSLCFVYYQVLSPCIRIHTVKTEFPILILEKLQHTNITSHHQVLLHNHGDITGCFVWGEPNKNDLMQLKFLPKSGILEPGNGKRQ